MNDSGTPLGPPADTVRPEPAPAPAPPEPTGHPEVDAALARLVAVDHLPADSRVDVYEDVHRGLRAALTALDAPAPPVPHDNRS
ncbi:hypothetical protein ACN20G_21680 [Streptomyces sp. BI20]|uniref:hypothetical protein n=1 Tax=Streptomyces sp. BI20 TaxID=3403460 RepID=UPI003C75C28E